MPFPHVFTNRITGSVPITITLERSCDNGVTWEIAAPSTVSNGTGLIGSDYIINPEDDGCLFRNRFTNGCGTVYGNSARVTCTGGSDLVPEISTQPSDQTVPVGGTATFDCGCVGGDAPVTGRWQEWDGTAWVDIPGETSNTLVVTAS